MKVAFMKRVRAIILLVRKLKSGIFVKTSIWACVENIFDIMRTSMGGKFIRKIGLERC